ncbi:MAG: hypothetical protein ABW001_11025 [Mycobacterium sp.]
MRIDSVCAEVILPFLVPATGQAVAANGLVDSTAEVCALGL